MFSFFEAATDLESLCDKIDNSPEITEDIKHMFEDAKSSLQQAVDRRISYVKYCESQIQSAKTNRDDWAKRAQRFEKILASIKEDTIATINANPSLPFRGTMGALIIQKNSVPSLNVDETSVAMKYWNKIPVLNRELIKRDLMAGEKVKGASLVQGHHLRIGLK